jgi:hypothetical protein
MDRSLVLFAMPELHKLEQRLQPEQPSPNEFLIDVLSPTLPNVTMSTYSEKLSPSMDKFPRICFSLETDNIADSLITMSRAAEYLQLCYHQRTPVKLVFPLGRAFTLEAFHALKLRRRMWF